MPNSLIHASSPYLLQHAHNPVDWYAWDVNLFEKARLENKLVLVSIGYAACHWCHVMEKECFEDKEVAEWMNAHFINIKIDREERPDLDHYFMDAMQALRGNGGWPLNVFCTPDKLPFYAVTYLPKAQWIALLQKILRLHQSEPQKIQQNAHQLWQYTLHLNQLPNTSQDASALYEPQLLPQIMERFQRHLDPSYGGLKRAPKFPTPTQWHFVIRMVSLNPASPLRANLELTLDNLMKGGLYDLVGGGFARYSVDEQWLVPHFEKMLYDNAQLICLYTEAYCMFRKPAYARVVADTVQFLQEELRNEDGTFASALDADSEGIEGKFYTWDYQELRSLLGEDFYRFEMFMDFPPNGNFEHGQIILTWKEILPRLTAEHGITEENCLAFLTDLQRVLKPKRNQRPKPFRDTKTILAWNAMTLKALALAARIFQQSLYQQLALQTYHSIKQSLTSSYPFYRIYHHGKKQVPAFAEDYAFYAEALLELYLTTAEPNFLNECFDVVHYLMEYFYDAETNSFCFAPIAQQDIPFNKQEYYDSVMPSTNAVIFHLLWTLYQINYEPRFKELVIKKLQQMLPMVKEYPTAYTLWGSLLLRVLYEKEQIIFTGKEGLVNFYRFSHEYFEPLRMALPLQREMEYVLFKGKEEDSETCVIYHCHEGRCNLPYRSWAEFQKAFNTSRIKPIG